MKTHKSKRRGIAGVGRNRLGLLGTGILVCVGLAGWDLAYALNDALACDVTTGASCKVLGVKTTQTSATISWTEKEHGSSRYFCYGIGSPSKCALVSSRAKGSKDQVVSGLAPQTKYAYKFYGVHSGKTLSVVTGSFTTVDGYVCGSSVISTVEVDGAALTAAGDSLENVIVRVSRKSDGVSAAQDTTNSSGTFHFSLNPGTYLINLSCPPFTAPAPYTATVIINKALTIPDFILTGASQVKGTVITPGSTDSIAGATVTMASKTNPTQSSAQVTNINGHFSFAVKPGTYLINVSYSGKSLPAPVEVAVAGDVKVADIVLNAALGIHGKGNEKGIGKGFDSWPIPGVEGFDANGAQRNGALSSHGRLLYHAP